MKRGAGEEASAQEVAGEVRKAPPPSEGVAVEVEEGERGEVTAERSSVAS